MQGIIFWMISLIPVALIILLLYKLDVVEKESLKLLIALFIGGCSSYLVVKMFTTIYTYFIPYINEFNFDEFNLMLIAFAAIAFIEEFSKYIVLNILTWKNREFNEVYDGILYGVIDSLGFAVIENIFYLADADISLLITRCLFSVPAHACFGIIMGYYYGYAKYYKIKDFNRGRASFNKYCGFFIAMVAHGTYDYILSSTYENNVYIFLVYMVVLLIFVILKIWQLVKYKITFNNR